MAVVGSECKIPSAKSYCPSPGVTSGNLCYYGSNVCSPTGECGILTCTLKAGEICSGSAGCSCLNACSGSQCVPGNPNFIWRCGNYDADPCSEWSVESCPSGITCNNGQCGTAFIDWSVIGALIFQSPNPGSTTEFDPGSTMLGWISARAKGAGAARSSTQAGFWKDRQTTPTCNDIHDSAQTLFGGEDGNWNTDVFMYQVPTIPGQKKGWVLIDSKCAFETEGSATRADNAYPFTYTVRGLKIDNPLPGSTILVGTPVPITWSIYPARIGGEFQIFINGINRGNVKNAELLTTYTATWTPTELGTTILVGYDSGTGGAFEAIDSVNVNVVDSCVCGDKLCNRELSCNEPVSCPLDCQVPPPVTCPSCGDRIQNCGETGVDCGSVCGNTCPPTNGNGPQPPEDGSLPPVSCTSPTNNPNGCSCTTSSQCSSTFCSSTGVCEPASCGLNGEQCCSPPNPLCNPGLTCSGGICIIPGSPPDLTTGSYSISPANPTPGTSMTFWGIVRNQGGSDAPPSTSRFQLDIDNDGTFDTTLGTPATGALPIGSSETETSNPWTVVLGTHRFQLCSDINNDVAESDETNNCGGLTFSVSACNDGIDNDLNGCADFPADTGCSSSVDSVESGGTCVPPGACNNNNICESGETQVSCNNDCKTTVSLNPSQLLAGQTTSIRIDLTDGRYKANDAVRFNLLINGVTPWSGCKIHNVVLNPLSLPSGVTINSKPIQVTVTATCTMPTSIAAGTHKLRVIPEIFS